MPFRFANWGLSKEDFFDGVSDPVNKELMDIFVQCGIVDRSGHGVPKVVKTYGREVFEFLSVGIMVTIPFDRKGFNVNNDFTINFTIKFTESEKKVISLIKANNRITTSELSERLNISRIAVQTIINSLKGKNVLIIDGSRKVGYWSILEPKKKD